MQLHEEGACQTQLCGQTDQHNCEGDDDGKKEVQVHESTPLGRWKQRGRGKREDGRNDWLKSKQEEERRKREKSERKSEASLYKDGVIMNQRCLLINSSLYIYIYYSSPIEQQEVAPPCHLLWLMNEMNK